MKFSSDLKQFAQLTGIESAKTIAYLMSDSRILVLDHLSISKFKISYEEKMKRVEFTIGGFVNGKEKVYQVSFFFAFEDFSCSNFSISPVKQ